MCGWLCSCARRGGGEERVECMLSGGVHAGEGGQAEGGGGGEAVPCFPQVHGHQHTL